jgi:hypothetical protein
MGAAFPALSSVGGDVQVSDNDGLLSIDGSFPVLASVGGALEIERNPLLQSLGAAFPLLTSIGDGLAISGDTAITSTSVGSAFCALTSVAGVNLNVAGAPSFDASTMIFVGNVIFTATYQYYPDRVTGASLPEIATMIANARVITGRVTIDTSDQNEASQLPPNFGTNVLVVSGVVLFVRNSFTSINGLFSNLISAGGVEVSNNDLATWGNAFSSLQRCLGTLEVNSNSNAGELNGIFPEIETVRGDLKVVGNDNVRTMTGAFPLLTWVMQDIIIGGDSLTTIEPTAFASLRYTAGVKVSGAAALTTMDGVFPMLQTIGYSDVPRRGGAEGLEIYNNRQLTSMVGAFPQLTSIELRMAMSSNDALQSTTGAFAFLVTVGRDISIRYNDALTGMTFASLTTIGGQLDFHNNGCPSNTGTCSRLFCTDVQSTLCAATPRYFFNPSYTYSSVVLFDARACCTAFCALPTSTCSLV